MGNFNRGRSGAGRGFGRRGPAEMHQAVCSSCRQNCEVPFRPTSGKPVYCSDCFGEKKVMERGLNPHGHNIQSSLQS